MSTPNTTLTPAFARNPSVDNPDTRRDTTVFPPNQSQVPPNQQAIDAAAGHLNDAATALDPEAAAQARNDQETSDENLRRYNEQQSTAQRKAEGIAAAQKQQEALNKHRETQIQNGDHVVIDLEQLNEHQHTVGIRNAIRHLLHAGAHRAAGQVSNIEDGPSGRVLTVQTAQATYTVPEALATRADLYEGD